MKDIRPVLLQLAFLLTLRRDLPNGGSAHYLTDLLTGWLAVHYAALSQGIGLRSSPGGNALQPEPTFSFCIANGNLVDCDNRSSALVFMTACLMVLVRSSNMLYT